jgi:hypothetical protein
MRKFIKLTALAAAAVFAMVAMVSAAEFFVVKGPDGKPAVVDKKPADASSVLKGPFPTKEAADKALKDTASAAPVKAEGAAKKPVKLPSGGC